MAATETKLQLLRLQVRIDILEQILFQLSLYLSIGTLAASAQERQQQLLERLEEVAQKGETFFLSLDRGDDAQRALYADELREVVEKMKKSLKKLPV